MNMYLYTVEHITDKYIFTYYVSAIEIWMLLN